MALTLGCCSVTSQSSSPLAFAAAANIVLSASDTPSSSATSVTCSLQLSVASSTALPKALDSADNSTEMSRKRVAIPGIQCHARQAEITHRMLHCDTIGHRQGGELGRCRQADEDVVEVAVLPDGDAMLGQPALRFGVRRANVGRVGNAVQMRHPQTRSRRCACSPAHRAAIRT